MHPPASFTMLSKDDFKLLLDSIGPFLFVHLCSTISPDVLAQFEFYLDIDFFNYLLFRLVGSLSR